MKKILLPLLIFLISALFIIQPALAKSKYSQNFIKHFAMCKSYTESKYNVAYNSHDTYQIKGFAPDGSGKCVYVETNEWQRGKYITTCSFLPQQHQEYYYSMLNPDEKTSVVIKGMAFVDANEKAVYLKYYNTPSVCQTEFRP